MDDEQRRRRRTVSKEWNPKSVFEVLASDECRQILAAASVRSVSAQELEQLCDVSLPTIYRRINVLLEYDFLSEEQVVDPEGGQYKQYSTDLEEIHVVIEEGQFDVNIEIRKDTVDKFGELFRDLGEGRRKGETDGRTGGKK